MNATADTAPHDRFPLSRILMLVFAGTFAGLVADIRVEHVDAVRERAVAWIPIIYSAFMAVACLVAFIFWNKTARWIMTVLFLAAIVVGGMGFYFHNEGDLKAVLKNTVSAWTDPSMNHPDGPPESAPLAFAGIGLVGILASLKRFNR